MKVLVGGIYDSSPLALAERAIAAAADQLKFRAIFVLIVRGRRLWVVGKNDPYTSDELVATFLTGSDPDWLAEEIEFVRGGGT